MLGAARPWLSMRLEPASSLMVRRVSTIMSTGRMLYLSSPMGAPLIMPMVVSLSRKTSLVKFSSCRSSRPGFTSTRSGFRLNMPARRRNPSGPTIPSFTWWSWASKTKSGQASGSAPASAASAQSTRKYRPNTSFMARNAAAMPAALPRYCLRLIFRPAARRSASS